MTDTLPPCDVAMELALVGHLLCQTSSEDLDTSKLQPYHLYDRTCSTIWEAIRDLDSEGKPFDAVSVAARLNDEKKLQEIGGSAKLSEIAIGSAFLGTALIKNYSDRITSLWKARQFIGACQVGQAEVVGAVDDVNDVILRHDKTITDLLMNGHSTGPVRFFTAVQSTYKRITSPESDISTRTGFPSLDMATGGGLHGGDLIIIAARPGMGKTAFLLNMLINIASRVKGFNAVAMCSLEMPTEQLVTRVICSESNVPMADVRSGRITDDSWSRLTAACTKLKDIPFWIDDQSGVTVQEIRAKIRCIKLDIARMYGVDVKLKAVGVDYLQLMRGDKSPNREQEVSSITRSLKALAKDEDLCIVALSQLNRETEKTSNKRPTLKDLRESGAIEQDSDTVIFIYREGYYSDEADQKEGEAIIAKQRNGPTKTVLLHWDPKRMRYTDQDTSHEFADEYDDIAEDWTP